MSETLSRSIIAITLPERAPGAAVEAGPGFLVYFGPEGGLQRLIGVGRGAEKRKRDG